MPPRPGSVWQSPSQSAASLPRRFPPRGRAPCIENDVVAAWGVASGFAEGFAPVSTPIAAAPPEMAKLRRPIYKTYFPNEVREHSRQAEGSMAIIH